MNKTQLIKALAMRAGVTQLEAARVVDALFALDGGVIPDALAGGQAVAIRDFGTFELRERAPRLARNPRTGERVQVPARKQPAWRPAAALTRRVDG